MSFPVILAISNILTLINIGLIIIRVKLIIFIVNCYRLGKHRAQLGSFEHKKFKDIDMLVWNNEKI